jgi:hypothetical protein
MKKESELFLLELKKSTEDPCLKKKSYLLRILFQDIKELKHLPNDSLKE